MKCYKCLFNFGVKNISECHLISKHLSPNCIGTILSPITRLKWVNKNWPKLNFILLFSMNILFESGKLEEIHSIIPLYLVSFFKVITMQNLLYFLVAFVNKIIMELFSNLFRSNCF